MLLVFVFANLSACSFIMFVENKCLHFSSVFSITIDEASGNVFSNSMTKRRWRRMSRYESESTVWFDVFPIRESASLLTFFLGLARQFLLIKRSFNQKLMKPFSRSPSCCCSSPLSRGRCFSFPNSLINEFTGKTTSERKTFPPL